MICARISLPLKCSDHSSAFYSDAIAEYIARHDPDVIVEKLNETWDGVDEHRDEFVAVSSRRVLERSDW